MTKFEDETPTGGNTPEEPNSSLEDRMQERLRTEESGASGHMTEAEFKAFMDEKWGDEADQGDLEMLSLTIHDIPDEVLLLLKSLAVKRGMTAEDLVHEKICNAFRVSKPPRLVEITEEQFQRNIDALMAAYEQEPIVIVDEKGRRFVLMPKDFYEARLTEIHKSEV